MEYMKSGFSCNNEILRNAIANNTTYIICEIFKLASKFLEEGYSVTFFEYYGPDNDDPNKKVFQDLVTFNNWVEESYPGLNC